MGQQIACLLLVAMAVGTIGSIVRIGMMENTVVKSVVYAGVVVVMTAVMVAFILGVI